MCRRNTSGECGKMSDVIKNYKEKRLIDYLKPGLRVLVKFDWHGLGDMIMFQPLYQRLKKLYPDVEWHLKPNSDQGYFAETPDASVDIIFDINFPETTAFLRDSNYAMSKPEACAILELGIPWTNDLEFAWKPEKWNSDLKIKENCIGFVHQVQSDPSKGINTGVSAIFWRKIKEAGFTPIEVQFCNPNANKKNGRPAFANYSCRDFEASVENLVAVLKQCKGFIGVNTGTFCAATCIMDGHVLALDTKYPFTPFYKRVNPVMAIDCRDPGRIDYKILENYLASCRS